MRLIFFDMDGVLTPHPHNIRLAEMTGRKNEFLKSFKEFFRGTIDDEKVVEWLVEKTAKLFVGVPESVLEDLGKELPITKGAVETIETLKKYRYHPILVTNGIEQVAGAFARRLGITEWYGNALEIRDGRITGGLHSSLLITLQSKGDLVRKIIAQRSSKKESVAVGNDVNDWLMLREVGFSILFNPSSDLQERLRWYADKGEKGFEKEFIEFSKIVNVVIEKPDLRLLIPFLVPEPTASPENSELRKEDSFSI